MRILMLCGTVLLLGAAAFWTQSDSGDESAEANLLNGSGERIGHATLTQNRQGVHIKVVLSHLPPGMHAMPRSQKRPRNWIASSEHWQINSPARNASSVRMNPNSLIAKWRKPARTSKMSQVCLAEDVVRAAFPPR